MFRGHLQIPSQRSACGRWPAAVLALALSLSLLLGGVSGASAQVDQRSSDPNSAPSPDHDPDPIDCLPKPLSAEMFEDLRTRSPFLRTLNFEETYALRGIANIEGEPVALLYNRKTEKTVRVTSKAPNDLGMQLVGVATEAALSEATVTLSFAGEEVTLNYSESQVKPQPRVSTRGGSDSRGERRMPPASLMEKYRTMSSQQRERYQRWKRDYLQKNPGTEYSAERFQLGERVIEAIKSGRDPDRVR